MNKLKSFLKWHLKKYKYKWNRFYYTYIKKDPVRAKLNGAMSRISALLDSGKKEAINEILKDLKK